MVDHTHSQTENNCEKDEKLDLSPSCVRIIIVNNNEARSSKLKKFCLSRPITVINGICDVLSINLDIFSTKSLAETNPTQKIEVK